MPLTRARVLGVLARFQAAVALGEPPLGDLIVSSTSLSVPGTEARRSAPSRSAILAALDAQFIDPDLEYDPWEVSVRPTERAFLASVPLAPDSSSERPVLLALEIGYVEGDLRILNIVLGRAP